MALWCELTSFCALLTYIVHCTLIFSSILYDSYFRWRRLKILDWTLSRQMCILMTPGSTTSFPSQMRKSLVCIFHIWNLSFFNASVQNIICLVTTWPFSVMYPLWVNAYVWVVNWIKLFDSKCWWLCKKLIYIEYDTINCEVYLIFQHIWNICLALFKFYISDINNN